MDRYDDDLLDSRHAYNSSEDETMEIPLASQQTRGELQRYVDHVTTQQHSFIRKPDYESCTQNELFEILHMLTKVSSPREIIDGIYISNLETARAYLNGEIWHMHPESPKINWIVSIINWAEPPLVRGFEKAVIADLLLAPNSGVSEHRILRLRIKDSESINYLACFPKICAFIHEARITAQNNAESGVEPNGGVLVHCYRGGSRSVTAVMAYLIWALHQSPVDAFHMISDRRLVAWPNREFFSQLNMWHTTNCYIIDRNGVENPDYTEYYLNKQLRPAVEFSEYGRNPNAEAIMALTAANMDRPAQARGQ